MAELSETDVPLADVPETDNLLMEAFADTAVGSNALWFALGKRRRENAE